jgi:LEA14-like dessication related protein
MSSELSSRRENLVLAAGLLAVLVVVAVVVPYGYYSTHQPSTRPRPLVGNIELESISVSITGVNGSGLGLRITAVVYNPNGFGATLDSLNYSVYADGHYLGNGRTAVSYDLAPQAYVTLVFPINVGLGPAIRAMGSYIVGIGHVTWEVKGTADVELDGLSVSAPFEFTTG